MGPRDCAKKRTDAEYELVDIEDFDLPLLDEPVPAVDGQVLQGRTPRPGPRRSPPSTPSSSSPPSTTTAPRARSRTPSTSSTREWNNKAAGFVGYGAAGGVRAVEQLRWSWPSSRSPTCARRSPCRWPPTSRTTRSSTRPTPQGRPGHAVRPARQLDEGARGRPRRRAGACRRLTGTRSTAPPATLPRPARPARPAPPGPTRVRAVLRPGSAACGHQRRQGGLRLTGPVDAPGQPGAQRARAVRGGDQPRPA